MKQQPMLSRFVPRFVASALVGFAALAAAVLPARATTVERVVSPGGIVAWLVEDHAVPMIAVDFAFTGGSVQDQPGKSGTARMVASLLGEGSGDLDSSAFAAALERKAIGMSFYAARDHVGGSMRTLTENRDDAFDLLRLALTAPRFDATDVELARAQILSMLRRQAANPNDIADREWWETAFAGHPYGRPVGGTQDTVAHISIDDLHDYAHRVLARGNVKIAVVGDIDAAALKPLLDQAFGTLPARAELTQIPDAAPQGAGRTIHVSLDVPQTVIDYGAPGISRHDPDFMAAYLINHILGGGSSDSRLYADVREKRGLVYSISNSLIWLDHAAVFLGGTATRADRSDETVDLVQKEIRRFALEGPTAAELAEAKSHVESTYALNLDSSTKIASILVQLQLDNLGMDYFQRRAGLIDAVTLADARRVAKRLFDGGMLITVVGRPQGVAAAEPSAAGAGVERAVMPLSGPPLGAPNSGLR